MVMDQFDKGNSSIDSARGDFQASVNCISMLSLVHSYGKKYAFTQIQANNRNQMADIRH
jgi:hypothetical protein